jgi:uncharacterized protein YejL (UPF0352 family)
MYQATNIASLETIHKVCTEVQAVLEAHYDADNPAACVDRGLIAEGYMATTGKLLADAKYHRDNFVNSAIAATIREALENSKMWSTSLISKKIEALAADYNYLVNWCERLNRACTHAVEWQRTLVSKHKAEQYNSNKSF